MLPLTHLQQAKPQPERQYSSQGFSSSRSGTPALDSLSAYEADATAARGLSHQSSALQPSFRSVLQPKQYRPVSRDSGNSAWAAPQHSPSELQGPRHMSLDRPPSNAASRLPVTRQHASRQSTASPATSVQRPASVQRQQSAARPASMQRQQSGARPASEQRMQSAARPASRQQLQSASTRAASKAEHDYASRSMGMTLSQYMSQMPSRAPAAGESWARPVSASLTAEDCEPPRQCSGLDDVNDCGDIIDDESPGWRDDDEWDTSQLPQTSTIAVSGQRGGGSFAGNPHLMLSARGNGLDLRPATASGILTSEPSSASSHDAHATRETDLGSLSAQLFAPRPQSQNGFRPPSRRLSRPPSAQRAASKKPDPLEAQHGAAPECDVEATGGQSASLLIKGGRKIQSARPADRGQRPPSRQKPPPEALHLFQPLQGSHTGGFAPSAVLRAAAASLARPSTSASIMQHAGPAQRSRPAPMLHTGRMTLADVQRLSDAAACNSQAIAAAAPVVAERAPRSVHPRPPSARPASARRL